MKEIAYRLVVDRVTIECYTKESLLQWISFCTLQGKTITSIESIKEVK